MKPTCYMFCENGFVKDDDGCDECECKAVVSYGHLMLMKQTADLPLPVDSTVADGRKSM